MNMSMGGDSCKISVRLIIILLSHPTPMYAIKADQNADALELVYHRRLLSV